MASAFTDLLNKPATAIVNAVAMHPKADDFCRELALRALFDNAVIGACIVYLNANAELNVVGRYGPVEVTDSIAQLRSEIETATRQKHMESLRIAEITDEETLHAALIPTPPTSASSGVIVIFFNEAGKHATIDYETQVTLAFACEMYCSPNWSFPATGSLRSKRSTTDEFGVISLTSRQKKVLELIAEGRTNDRIARVLNYSVATVKNDISAIFQFLGVNNRHDAVDEAGRRELVAPPPANRNQVA
jgi:DNA-binding CsgD family transcriptional regulator